MKMSKEFDICYCNRCEKECKIEVLYKYTVPLEESFEYDVAKDEYSFVKCMECNSFFIKNDSDEILGDVVESKVYTIPPKNIVTDKFKDHYIYPPLIHNEDDPYYIFKMYREVLTAVNAKSFWLAFCGIRSVIEQICQNKFNCKASKFKDMLKNINNTPFISEEIKSAVIAVLNATHASVHGKFIPTKEQIMKCMECLQIVLEQIYILPKLNDEIKHAKLPGKNRKIPND